MHTLCLILLTSLDCSVLLACLLIKLPCLVRCCKHVVNSWLHESVFWILELGAPHKHVVIGKFLSLMLLRPCCHASSVVCFPGAWFAFVQLQCMLMPNQLLRWFTPTNLHFSAGFHSPLCSTKACSLIAIWIWQEKCLMVIWSFCSWFIEKANDLASFQQQHNVQHAATPCFYSRLHVGSIWFSNAKTFVNLLGQSQNNCFKTDEEPKNNDMSRPNWHSWCSKCQQTSSQWRKTTMMNCHMLDCCTVCLLASAGASVSSCVLTG